MYCVVACAQVPKIFLGDRFPLCLGATEIDVGKACAAIESIRLYRADAFGEIYRFQRGAALKNVILNGLHDARKVKVVSAVQFLKA